VLTLQEKINFLFVGLGYLEHNYGAQGIAFPLMAKLSGRFTSKYTFVLSHDSQKWDKLTFRTVAASHPLFILGKCCLLFLPFYLFIRRKVRLKDEKTKYFLLINALKDSDVIIDLSGIEFIGNLPLIRRYSQLLSTISMQLLAEKHNKIYLKYTKSYGPFPNKDKVYRFFARKQLNKLPFVFVRGENNLKNIRKLGLNIPAYSFPDISISLQPETEKWALDYVNRLGIDVSQKICGLSPSTVIASIEIKSKNSSCGASHVKLCKKIVEFYRLNNRQVILIPHSIYDGKNTKICDLALCKKIYTELKDKKGVFIINDMDLTYEQVRAIIGLLDFHITGRYHSLCSALSMTVPVVSLSWHIKYEDVMRLFLEDFLAIDCRKTNVEKSLKLITKYYDDRQWFDKEEIQERKKRVLKEIDKSITILANFINKVKKESVRKF
jgi:polysaccharide pyruvyl transferase WcaK-like protein